MSKIETISDWISSKPPRGKYTFSREEVLTAFPNCKPETISAKLSREVRKGKIMIPVNGFYVIIPDEYLLRGFAPQPFYLDDMMLHLKRRYYVALLNAGSYHGAGHQAPMTFCVMLEPPAMHDKKTVKYSTRFFYRTSIPMEYVERNCDAIDLSPWHVVEWQDKIIPVVSTSRLVETENTMMMVFS